MWIRQTNALLALVTLTASTLVAAAGPAVSINPPDPQEGEPFTLSIKGERADTCVPELDRFEVAADEIRIFAHRANKACAKAATDWQINIDSSQLQLDAGNAVLPVKFLVVETQGENQVVRLKAFDLLAIGGSEVRPEAGIWWAEAGGRHGNGGPGTGYSLEMQGDRVLLMANVYDSQGNPQWLFSNGPLSQGVLRTQLLSLYGGQPLFGDYVAPEAAIPAGEVLVHFDSPSTATAWFVAPASDEADPDLALKPLSLVRYAFGLGAAEEFHNGRWLMVTDDADDARALDLMTTSRPGSAVIEMRDANQGFRLDCTAASGRFQTPARRCSLLSADGSLIGVLNEIGLNRMRGETIDGRRISLFRW